MADPSTLREHGMTLAAPPEISSCVQESAWRVVYADQQTTRRFRTIGYVRASLMQKEEVQKDEPTPLDVMYTIVQVEERSISPGRNSIYRSRILLGTLVDSKHQSAPFKGSRGCKGLWCTGCWSDDIYGSEEGGVEVPPESIVACCQLKTLRLIPNCMFCGSMFVPFELGGLIGFGQSRIFSSVKCRPLQEEVERELASKGVLATKRSRSEDVYMSEELANEIIQRSTFVECA